MKNGQTFDGDSTKTRGPSSTKRQDAPTEPRATPRRLGPASPSSPCTGFLERLRQEDCMRDAATGDPCGDGSHTRSIGRPGDGVVQR